MARTGRLQLALVTEVIMIRSKRKRAKCLLRLRIKTPTLLLKCGNFGGIFLLEESGISLGREMSPEGGPITGNSVAL